MKVDDTGSISIFYLEPTDERATVLEEVDVRRGRKAGIVIVLPNESTKAFRSPMDFRELMVRKRQGGPTVIFIIPKRGVAQWARASNFTVYPSLEALIKATEVKQSRELVSSPQAEAISASEKEDAALPSESTPQPFEEGQEVSQSSPAAYSAPQYTHVGAPVTPLPEVSEEFLQQISTQLAAITPQEEEQGLSLASTQIPSTPSTPVMPPPPVNPEQPHKQRVQPILIAVLVIVLISATLSGFLLFTQRNTFTATTRNTTAAPAIVGHLYFLSSGQIDALGKVGINDEVEVQISHIPQPPQGKAYYVWLRSDTDMSDGPVLLLGQLAVDAQGNAHLANTNSLHLYEDPQHTNLLASLSQLLITQEDAEIAPTVPSPDRSVWRYNGMIPQTPNPQDTQSHFSLLDHMRHLLAAEPVLEKLGLHGGLSLWLYRNVQKLNEYATSARDEQNPALQHRQIIRILDYLDGVKDVSRDVPAQPNATDANQGRVLVDSTQASVGLLQIHAYQDPSSLLQQTGFHLTSLVNSPGATKEQQRLAAQLDIAINNVQSWLSQMRQDAQQLVTLSDDQLRQAPARALLNDLVNQGANALNGFPDPATGTTQNGANWIHNTMQELAIIDVQIYKP